jgi:hypothetical protein
MTSETKKEHPMQLVSTTTVTEIVLFRFTDTAAAPAAMAAIQTFVTAQPGFVSRRAFVSGDGAFVDLVEWADRASAEAAAQAIGTTPSLAAAMAAIDGSSVQMGHYGEVLLP